MTQNAVVDYGTPFVINATTKEISYKAANKPVLVRGDHQSERFTFEVPRYIEGHDMSLCGKIEIHFINTDAETNETSEGIYIVNDAHVSTKFDKPLKFTWLVSMYATKYAGNLSFKILFETLEGEEVVYRLNTEPYTELTVSDTLTLTPTSDEVTEPET